MTPEQAKILRQSFFKIAEVFSETLTAFIENEETPVQIFPRSAMHENRLLNRKEIAERLGVSVRTVGNLIKEGLPTVPVGERRVLFDCEEVLTWAKDKRIEEAGKIEESGKTKLRAVS